MIESGFRVAESVLHAVTAHARAAAPRECCGMLIGAGNAIRESMPAANLAGKPTEFLIDPKDHIEALRRARRRGLEVLGFYHSHPQTPAWPSATDVAQAAYPDAVHLIVTLAAEDTVGARLFRIAHGAATELLWVVER
jgi:proteasome lid subunit RPN8/RPN11